MGKQILTTKLSIKHLNFGKKSNLALFLQEYKNAVKFYVDYLFNNEISFYYIKDKIEKFVILNIKKDLLNLPLFVSNKQIPYNSTLSERVLKCALTQSLGIIRSCIDKRKKLLYILSLKKSKKENRRTRNRSLLKKIDKNQVKYPNISNVYPELNSIVGKFCDENITKSFDDVFILSSLGKSFGKIIIPLNNNKHSNKLEQSGKRMSSFQISEKYLYIRYETDLPELKTSGEIEGVDQGIKTCLTLSDGQVSKKLDGHDLDTITDKISRKKKGSKAFHKALDHRDNYIGWSVNQLNLTNIKQLNVESISNFRNGKNVGKKLNYFGEPLILERLKCRAQQEGVLLVEQSSAYRSQRCSHCGYVCKKNRKGKLFCCRHCSFQADADCNASCNHKISLPSIPYSKLHPLDNKNGFFWKENGLFNLKGEELTVPLAKKDSH